MSDIKYLSKAEAEAACNCSGATLQRYMRKGLLPNSIPGKMGQPPRYAVADLVAAGLLDPLAAAGPIEETAGRTRTERDLVLARTELAVANSRITELSARIERTEGEVTFLRSMIAKTAVA